MNLLIFGTSITWGAWDSEGGWAQRLKSYYDKNAAEPIFHDYISVYCLGVSGDTSADILERFDAETKARIDEKGKTVVIIETGINDSHYVLSTNQHIVPPEEYRNNLISLVEKSKQLGTELIFLGLTPVDDSKVDPTPWTPGKSYRLEFVKQYEEILKKVATEQNTPFIEVMSKFMEKDYKTLLVDGLHPNTEGHKILYEEVKKHLLEKGVI